MRANPIDSICIGDSLPWVQIACNRVFPNHQISNQDTFQCSALSQINKCKLLPISYHQRIPHSDQDTPVSNAIETEHKSLANTIQRSRANAVLYHCISCSFTEIHPLNLNPDACGKRSLVRSWVVSDFTYNSINSKVMDPDVFNWGYIESIKIKIHLIQHRCRF